MKPTDELLGVDAELANPQSARTREAEERLAEYQRRRRSRGEEAFASKRWSCERAVSWIGFRNKPDLDRPTSHGVMYDYEGSRLVDREPEQSFVEAIREGRIVEFKDIRGRVWYYSKHVIAAFPEANEGSPAQGGLEAAIDLAKPANKGGRPPAVDWKVVKDEVFRLMDYNRDFGPDDPDWNAQARLEEALEDYCETEFGKRPAKSTIQLRIKPWLEEWRNSKARCPET